MRLPRKYERRTELVIQRSVFRTVLARTDSEQEARNLVAAIRHEFPGARHHCSAFLIEVPGAEPIARSSDDGEPAGTAGMPMLEALRGSGLSNVTAVVVRWFGGIKLGTGGLVRAYTQAVQQAVAGTPRVEARTQQVFALTLPHSTAGRTRAALSEAGIEVLEASYGAAVTFLLTAPNSAELQAKLSELTGGNCSARPHGSRTIEVPLPPPGGPG